MKICNKCGKEKELCYFSKNKRNKDGFCNMCKSCSSEYQKTYREENKDILEEKSITQRKLKSKENNERAKKWYKNNKDKKKSYDKEYAKRTEEHRRQRSKEYYNNNKEEIIAKNCKYIIEKHKTDEKFNIKMRLRHRLGEAFRRFAKNGKVGASKDYGIDWQKIIDYLGPCPGPREDYHIDHIIPLCSFNFDIKEEVERAFAPENHQWLKKEENLKKNRKMPQIKEE